MTIDNLFKRAEQASAGAPSSIHTRWQRAHALLVECQAAASDETGLSDLNLLVESSAAALAKNFVLEGLPSINPGTPENLSTVEDMGSGPGSNPIVDNVSAGTPPASPSSGTAASGLPPAGDSGSPLIPGVTKSEDDRSFDMTEIRMFSAEQ